MDLDDLRVDVYKAYLEDVNDLREDRQKSNGLYVTIATFLLGAQAYVASPILASALSKQIVSISLSHSEATLGAIVIGVVGLYFCVNWLMLNRDYKRTLNVKYQNLLAMEKDYPMLKDAGAKLFTLEREERKKSSGTARRATDLATFFLVLFIVIAVAATVLQLLPIAGLTGLLAPWVSGR